MNGKEGARIEAERAAAAAAAAALRAARTKDEAENPYMTLLPAWKQRDTFLRTDKDLLKHLKMELASMEEQVRTREVAS